MISPFIFREYDIRGVVGKDLTDEVANLLGKGIGTYLARYGVKRITVGGDVRLSTEQLRKHLMEGLRSTGINVVNLGQVPTPVQYFSMHRIPDVQGGVMITGSHNPPEFNGFKITMNNAPVFGSMIQEIRVLIEKGDFEKGSGGYEEQEIIEDYINYIKKNIKLERPVKVVLDSGNGAAALVAHRLLKELGAETIDLFDTPDGRFPNHHPDPTVVKYIQTLIKTTKESDAELGIGYDGDADRIGVVDENGDIIWGDKLMIIFSREILREHPGASIIFDVKCSQALSEMIEKFGGKPVMSKTGHSNLKQKMKDLKAPFAGEMSGHIFFADRYFGFDDAIYASARMVELVSRSHKKVSELLADVPKYYSTPEIRAEVESDAVKFKMAEEAEKYFSEHYNVIAIDGVRIQFGDGWGLVRASNTQPVLVLRFEARTPERLKEIQDIVVNKLKEFGKIKI